MASSGAAAWNKYFKDKGSIATVMKKDSALYDNSGKNVGRINAGTPVIVVEQSEYTSRYPIQTQDGKVSYVTFDNIQKPKTKATQGIKLKPQDFNCIKAKQLWSVDDLCDSLTSEIEDRTDLDPGLKNYLIAITKYYGKKDNVTSSDVSELFTQSMPGLAELQKDYGEMLGAIACIQQGLLTSSGIKLTKNDKIYFPIRGNEPVVDYYINPTVGKPVAISAKSGETTNTLKPGDIITLLDSTGKTNTWKNTTTYKMMQLVAASPTVQFPFFAINVLFPGTLQKNALTQVETKFKAGTMTTKNYDVAPFSVLFSKLGLSVTDKPSIGALFYATEKFVIQTLNTNYKDEVGKIFENATSGLVTYVKFKVDSGSKYGKFDVLASDASGVKKKDVKWRSKNATSRASDKIGLQP